MSTSLTALRSFSVMCLVAITLMLLSSSSTPVMAQIPILTPNTSNNLYVYCYVPSTGEVIPYCDVTFDYGYYVYSNYHLHESASHPSTTVSPAYGNTGASGNLPVTLKTSIVGQGEFFTIYDLDDGTYSNTDFYVGYDDLNLMPANDSYYVLIGGNTTQHGDNSGNHWGTANMQTGIFNSVTTYLSSHPEQVRLALNDMGLPIGGKFDIQQNWASPHMEHDRGSAVDVRGNGGQYAIPDAYQFEFITYCYANFATSAIQESVGTTNQHVHCRW